MASKQQDSTKPTMENKNVAGGQLAFFSKVPLTGFYRDGYCRTGPEDTGNHAIAAEMTKEFLNYSASAGNNLKDVGVKPGMKWCLCAKRWKEAVDAARRGELSKEAVPRVYLHASHESALKVVGYKEMKEFEAERTGVNQSGRQTSHYEPKGPGGIAKESKELGGDMGTTAPSGSKR